MSVHKQGKKNRKHGRAARKPKNKRYVDLRVRYYNKYKKILKSNGPEKALEYAREHSLIV